MKNWKLFFTLPLISLHYSQSCPQYNFKKHLPLFWPPFIVTRCAVYEVTITVSVWLRKSKDHLTISTSTLASASALEEFYFGIAEFCLKKRSLLLLSVLGYSTSVCNFPKITIFERFSIYPTRAVYWCSRERLFNLIIRRFLSIFVFKK